MRDLRLQLVTAYDNLFLFLLEVTLGRLADVIGLLMTVSLNACLGYSPAVFVDAHIHLYGFTGDFVGDGHARCTYCTGVVSSEWATVVGVHCRGVTVIFMHVFNLFSFFLVLYAIYAHYDSESLYVW